MKKNIFVLIACLFGGGIVFALSGLIISMYYESVIPLILYVASAICFIGFITTVIAGYVLAGKRRKDE